MNLKIEDEKKVDILMDLLPQFWKEAVHWRDDSWRFTRWIITLFVSIAGISIFTTKNLMFFTPIFIVLLIGSTLYLIKNYYNYRDRLKLFYSIEEALMIFEEGVYKKDSVIPKNKLKKEPIFVKGQGIYILFIWIVGIASWLSIFFKIKNF